MRTHGVSVTIIIVILSILVAKAALMSDTVKDQCLSSCDTNNQSGNSCKSVCDGESILCRHAANNPIEVYLCSKCQFFCVACCVKKERDFKRVKQWRKRTHYFGKLGGRYPMDDKEARRRRRKERRSRRKYNDDMVDDDDY